MAKSTPSQDLARQVSNHKAITTWCHTERWPERVLSCPSQYMPVLVTVTGTTRIHMCSLGHTVTQLSWPGASCAGVAACRRALAVAVFVWGNCNWTSISATEVAPRCTPL
jgi:hypothetical protein